MQKIKNSVDYVLQEVIKTVNDNTLILYRNSTMNYTYLTTEELSDRIKYDSRTIRNQLKDSVLIEGVHYIRPFNGRKILFIWQKIEELMLNGYDDDIPFVGGA